MLVQYPAPQNNWGSKGLYYISPYIWTDELKFGMPEPSIETFESVFQEHNVPSLISRLAHSMTITALSPTIS